MAFCTMVFFSQLITVYLLGVILFGLFPFSEKRRLWFRSYQQRLFLFDFHHIPCVRFSVEGITSETFSPSIVISNHQSMLDAALFMALSPKAILVSNKKVSSNLIIKKIFKWNGFITLNDMNSIDDSLIQYYVEHGYSLVIFPEGVRNAHSSIRRFHKGAFLLAEKYQLDIQPFIIHGLNMVLPRNSIQVFPGQITVKAYQRIRNEAQLSYAELTSQTCDFYRQEYARIACKIETAAYYSPLVLDRYRYKGEEIFRAVRKNLKNNNNYTKAVDTIDEHAVVLVKHGGYGEFALLYALVHRQTKVLVYETDENKKALLTYCAQDLVDNLEVIDSLTIEQEGHNDLKVFSL